MIRVCTPWYPGNELKYVTESMASGAISGSFGSFIEQFEGLFAKYCGSKYGISCSNGTCALHLAYMALDIKRGDEVIVTTFTNIATVNTIILTGAKPVLVDIEKDTWNIDVKKIEEKITPKTKAIVPVHIYGHPCDMDPIMKIAEKYNLFVVEDAAEAHGAEYKGRKCGSIGHIGCFSFYANKILNTGEGGMCLTNNKELAEKMKRLRNLDFGTPRYMHKEIGFNYRLTNIQAAIGVAQVENAEMLVEARRNIGLKYNKKLKDIPGLVLPVEKDYAKNVYWMYGVVLGDEIKMSKEEVMKKLEAKGIDTRGFFIPMNQQPAYLKKKYENVPDCNGDFSIADKISSRGFYLPSSSNLRDEEIDFIVKSLKEILFE